jgi:hypothetical protein
VKKANITFLFLMLNGTWALMAYLLYLKGIPHTVIATAVAIGVLIGNVSGYIGLRLAQKLLRKRG